MTPDIARQDGPDVLLSLRLQPRSSRTELVKRPDGLTLRLTAPPVEGAANAACLVYLAKLLDCARSLLSIEHGEHARQKQIRIRNTRVAKIRLRLRLED